MKLFPFLLVGALVPLASVPVLAQDGAYSSAVVQPLPPPAADELKIALGRLARESRNVDALLAAGTASLELGDIDAAIGFFGRAEALAPQDPRIKAGKAAAYVQTKRPDEALKLFQEAEEQGVEIVKLAGDYGLAWDLVGNNQEAQLRYRRALASAPGNDEVTRRLALSLAIDGNLPGFEETLRPLLEKRDFAAYRTRAFGLAILGKPDDAVAITEAVMDRPTANKIEPYLRFMPQLTKAQQAAAANLGIYPTATRIGRDDPRIAALSGGTSGRAKQVADAGLAPAGAPLGAASAPPAAKPPSRPAEKPREEAPVKRSPPAAEMAKASTIVEQPPAAATGSTRLAEVTVTGEPAAATQPAAQLASVEDGKTAPGFDLSKLGGSSSAPAQAAATPAGEAASVADAFAEFAAPVTKTVAAPAAGAVDITSIKAPREVARKEPVTKPEPKAEPAKPVAPSRYWVQVATGQDTSALRFDWRRLSKQADGLLDGKGPYVTAWGQTNRLLAGPYKTRDEARKALKDLQEKGFDAFTFTSPEGQEVDQLR